MNEFGIRIEDVAVTVPAKTMVHFIVKMLISKKSGLKPELLLHILMSLLTMFFCPNFPVWQ